MSSSLTLLFNDFSCEDLNVANDAFVDYNFDDKYIQMYPWPLREAMCDCLPDKKHSKLQCKWREPPSTVIRCVADPVNPERRTWELCGGAKEHCPEKPLDFRQQCSRIALEKTFDITDPFLRFENPFGRIVDEYWDMVPGGIWSTTYTLK